MSTPKGAAMNSGAAQGGYTTSWRATVSGTLEPQTYGQLIQLYGDLPRMWDFLMWSKRTTDVKGRTVTVFEEGAIYDTLDVSSEVSTNSAGQDITVVSAKSSGRIGFDVHIPAQYTNQEIAVPYKITAKSGTGPYTYTLSPWNSTFQITTAIPVAQKLILGASSYAPGEAQPASMKRSWYSHTHNTRIMKETLFIEGGQPALQEYAEMSQSRNGSTLVNRSLNETEFRLRIQQNDYLLMGQPNNNSFTGANSLAETNNVISDYGLVPYMHANAMKQYYTGSYTRDNFNNIKFLLASQGVGSGIVDYMYGQELGLGIENMGLDFTREFSGGTNLYSEMGKLGFSLRQYVGNGITAMFTEIPEFSNPLAYGANGYNFETMGMIFPNAKVTSSMNYFNESGLAIGSEKKALNHVTLGYLNNNGENRTLVVGDLAGVNALGYKFTGAYDQMMWYMLVETMSFFLAINQSILVLKSE